MLTRANILRLVQYFHLPMARLNARQPTCWLLLIAVLFATLAPTLGMALGGHGASRTVWTELCSVDGRESIAIHVDDDRKPFTDADNAHQGHCLLCFQPSTTPQPASLETAASIAVVLRVAQPDAAPPRYASVWNLPLARAPPAFS